MAYNIFDFSHFWSNLKTLLNNKVDKVSGMGLSQNSFTNAYKTKLDGIDTGATKTVVDAALSSTSTNPVQNKAVQAPVARLVDAGAKNLLNLNTTFTSYEHRGITYTNNHDGTIRVSGTSNANDSYVTIYDIDADNLFGISKGRTIVIASTSDNVSISIVPKKGESYGKTVSAYKSSPVVYTIPSDFSGFMIRVGVYRNGTTVNEDVNGMICISEDYDISSEFVPYAKSNYELTQDVEPIPRLVDAGAKNFMPLDTATFLSAGVGNEFAVKIPIGDYVLSCNCSATSSTSHLYLFDANHNEILHQPFTNNANKKINLSLASEAVLARFDSDISNTISKIMICTTTDYAISPEFVPYTKSNYELTQDVEPIPRLVDAGAKNILYKSIPTYTYGGITLTANADGSITVNGTSTELVEFKIGTVHLNVGNYHLSGCYGTGSSSTYALRIYGSQLISDYGNGVDFSVQTETDRDVYIVIATNITFTNAVFKPMVCTAEDYAISTEFVPYAPSNRELYEAIAPMQANSMKLVYRLLLGEDSGTATYRMVTTDFTAVNNAQMCGMYLITIISWSVTPTASIYIAYYSGGTPAYNGLVKIGGEDAQLAIDDNRMITYTGKGKIQIYALQ